MDEKQQHKNTQDIALIKNDISYIKRDVKDIKDSLTLVLEQYIQRQEVEARFSRIQEEMDGRIGGLNNRLDKKLDIEDFEPYKSTMNKINWLLISGVIGTLLAIIGLK